MEDWLPGLAEPGVDHGRQFGIPWYAANRVVIYNKDLFAAAGIKNPPTTRDEWLDLTRSLDSDGRQGIYLAGQDWYTLSGFIWDEGGELAHESAGTWTGALDTPRRCAAWTSTAASRRSGRGRGTPTRNTPRRPTSSPAGTSARSSRRRAQRSGSSRRTPRSREAGVLPHPGQDRPPRRIGLHRRLRPRHPREHRRPGERRRRGQALAGEKWNTELARTMNYVPSKTTLASAVAGEPGVAAMAVGAAHGKASASPLAGRR